MKIGVCHLELRTALTPCFQRLAERNVSWVQFGNQLFVLSPNEHWEELQNQANETGTALKALSSEAELEELFLIRQKGRLFQQEHPDIPVLLDRGRYLVVQISNEAERQLTRKSAPCYQVLALHPFTVVFEEHHRPAVRATVDPWIVEVVDRLDQQSFRQKLKHLASYHTRHSLSSYYPSAVEWCQTQFVAMGYQTHLEHVSIGVNSSRNLIAGKTGHGSDEHRQVLLLTAHLDSINWAEHGEAEAISPGADDNGTGSAGLLEIAGVLSNYSFVHDLRFVLFCGEEEGLCGSKEYVKAMSQVERSRIKAVVNMDMIGGLNTQSPSVTLESSTKYSQVVKLLVDAGHAYTDLNIETSFHYFDSDHVPFIDSGIPAVLTIEGADSSNQYVHGPEDFLDKISDTLALNILRMNTAFIAMNAR